MATFSSLASLIEQDHIVFEKHLKMTCTRIILLLSICSIAFGLDKSPSFSSSTRHDAFIKILKRLYARSQASIGFCFGSNPQKILNLIGLSFPWPLPVMDSSHGEDKVNPICSNRTAISLHLCGPNSIELYYRFMLLTENPEKVPATRNCPSGGSFADGSSGCAPGFFAARKIEEESRSHHQRKRRLVAHACCPGYFCPSNLVCMIPCPLGAHCPRAKPELPPPPFQNSQRSGSRWCAPYAYRERPEIGCGGADRWSIVPSEKAFPGTSWEAGTGSIYCKPRYYCLNTTTAPIPCPRGRFCRQGSTEPAHCPPGAWCPPLIEVPLSNFGGVTADALLLCVLGMLWWANNLKRRMLVRLGPRERLKIMWRPYGPRFTVVKRADDDTNDSNARSLSASSSFSFPPLASATTSFSPDATTTEDTFPLEIEFKNLSLRLKSCGRLVLSNVSANLQAAKLTAIMGASGSGKTSLLSALAGRAPYGDVSGTLYINGKCTQLELYCRVTGFVPQDDILYAALSVEENLLFSSQFRLPANTTVEERRMRVDTAIVSLGLESVRRDIVGGETQRGLSGGQRKRVSIGVELVAAPKLLLLDEPTSGLDAAGARDLVRTLVNIVSRDKVTAAAVVHQPRHEVFQLFNDVLLLGKGGRVAYYGPVAQVEDYFLSLGHRFPVRTNPADALLDMLAEEPDALCTAWDAQRQQTDLPTLLEDVLSSPSSLADDSTHDAVVLGDLYEESSASLLQRMKETAILAIAFALKMIISLQDSVSSFFHVFNSNYNNTNSHQQAGYSPLSSSLSRLPAEVPAEVLLPPSPGFYRQFMWCLSRAATLRSRQPVQVFTDIAIISATGIAIGLLSDRGRATILSYASQVSYTCVALGLMATVGSIPTFKENEAAFRREAASGLNRVAYFTALSLFDFIGSAIRAAAYLATWTSYANPKTVLWQMYVVSLGLFWFCSGTGYVLALGLGSGNASLAAAVITLISTLIARQPGAHGLLSLVQKLSFARWALEGFVIAESNRLSGVWLLARCADLLALGYDVRRFATCLVALTVLGILTRLVALCMLLLSTS